MVRQRTREETQSVIKSKILIEGDCWIWQGLKSSNGYGQMRCQGKPNQGSHRVSYWAFVGDIPDGMVVRHHPTLCNNKHCVNPDHLLLGTQQDNIDDKQVANTQCKGETNGRSKLTEQMVIEMRHLYDTHIKGKGSANNKQWSVPKLAQHFNISPVTADKVCRRQTWTHLL